MQYQHHQHAAEARAGGGAGYQECRGELVDYGELALRRAVVDGEPWAVGLVLKTLGRDRGYVERTENMVTGKDGGPVTMRVVYGDDGPDDSTA